MATEHHRTVRMDDGESLLVDEHRRLRQVRSPGEALTWHLDQHRWTLSRYGAANFEEVCRTMHEEGPTNRDDLLSTPARPEARGRQALAAAMLDSAPTYYVSAEIAALVDGIAATFTDGDLPTLAFSDVPSPTGLLVYERAFRDTTMTDIGDFLVVRALAWRIMPPGQSSAEVTIDGHLADLEFVGPDDSPMNTILQYGGLLVSVIHDGPTLLVSGDEAYQAWGRPPGLFSGNVAIPFGVRADYGQTQEQARIVHRHITALLRLMWQRIIAPDPAPIDRAGRRRWGRQMQADVNVVHLRRYVPRHKALHDHPAGDGHRLQWTVPVRGHWRDQWFGTLGPAYHDDGTWNPDSHRRIWIDAHLRGDGPLADPRYQITAITR